MREAGACCARPRRCVLRLTPLLASRLRPACVRAAALNGLTLLLVEWADEVQVARTMQAMQQGVRARQQMIYRALQVRWVRAEVRVGGFSRARSPGRSADAVLCSATTLAWQRLRAGRVQLGRLKDKGAARAAFLRACGWCRCAQVEEDEPADEALVEALLAEAQQDPRPLNIIYQVRRAHPSLPLLLSVSPSPYAT